MKQVSPARLTRPLKRREGALRGAGEFEPITWDEAFAILEKRLTKIRATDPKKFALFYRARPDAGADWPFCAAVRHAQLRRARRLLLGEYGCGHDLHDRRLILGVRWTGSGGGAKLFVMLGTRGGSSLQSAENRHFGFSSGAAAASSRSIRCAPAIQRSPTNGYRSVQGRTGHCCSHSNHEIIAQGLYDRDFVAPLYQRRTPRHRRFQFAAARPAGPQTRTAIRSILSIRRTSCGGTARERPGE